ncbi:MAG: ABC transporter ATP-binding protein [Candidatus Hodarchaeales archaeon]|jgi:branched-chain amino acid transport system ATP-binding protein
MTRILAAEKVDKNFGGVQALKDVSIHVQKSAVVGLIGPNGSGKTTFFNVSTGWLPNDNKDGSISFNSKKIDGMAPHDISLMGLARTFQKTRIFRDLTTLDNMLLAAQAQRGEGLFRVFLGRQKWKKQEQELRNRAFEILGFLEIKHLVDEPAANLSGGQQKLLALGRVLMAAPKLVLLDEPVAGVNPTLAKKIFKRILQLREEEELTFFIVEHNMDVIMAFCDTVFVMHRGEVLTTGTPDEIKSNREVVEAYLGG